MVRDGLFLMAIGMVTVFAFLTALVASLSVTAGMFRRFARDTHGVDDERGVAVRAAAVAASFQYHQQRRRNDETR